MDDLPLASLLARYEKLDNSSKAYVAGYVDDAVKRLDVALSIVERVVADRQCESPGKVPLRCVYSRRKAELPGGRL